MEMLGNPREVLGLRSWEPPLFGGAPAPRSPKATLSGEPSGGPGTAKEVLGCEGSPRNSSELLRITGIPRTSLRIIKNYYDFNMISTRILIISIRILLVSTKILL